MRRVGSSSVSSSISSSYLAIGNGVRLEQLDGDLNGSRGRGVGGHRGQEHFAEVTIAQALMQLDEARVEGQRTFAVECHFFGIILEADCELEH